MRGKVFLFLCGAAEKNLNAKKVGFIFGLPNVLKKRAKGGCKQLKRPSDCFLLSFFCLSVYIDEKWKRLIAFMPSKARVSIRDHRDM